MNVVSEFLDFAKKEYGLDFPLELKADGKQHRYKMPGDKGASKSGFVTFYLDDNPMAIFGDWKKYGKECFKWFFRNQKELSKREKDEYKARMRESMAIAKAEDEARKKAAAIKAGQLWQLPAMQVPNYQYLLTKKVGAYGVKFFHSKTAFEFFSSEERKELHRKGEIEIANHPIMVVPVINKEDQLVSLQQISPNGKFKGFLPGGMKKGCFHVIVGTTDYVFVAEGYATAATIFELTGCTVYVAFDCGNLKDVCFSVMARHPDAIKLIASDDDRFTYEPVANPGQTKANEICEETDFHNMKPNFKSNENGTDWNDLLNYRSRDSLFNEMLAFVNRIQA